MDVAELHPSATVVLSTDRLILSIEKLNDGHCAINAGCNNYEVKVAIVEIASGAYALLAVPISGKKHAFLDPPTSLVLNFWDQTWSSNGREDPARSTFSLENFETRTRYIFRFDEDIEYAKCMEFFFITRRLVHGRNREIDMRNREIMRLQDDVLVAMAKEEVD